MSYEHVKGRNTSLSWIPRHTNSSAFPLCVSPWASPWTSSWAPSSDPASLAGFSGNQTRHENFIKFLQFATSLGVDILPLSWDTSLSGLSRDGGTSRVSQSLLNAAVSFVYKRMLQRSTCGVGMP